MPTTSISLIREHTERIRPPRALWVPFELGRPLGMPQAPAFQRAVLITALLFVVGDTPHRVRAGDMVAVPPDVPHTVQLLSATARLVDAFHPMRQDFLEGDD